MNIKKLLLLAVIPMVGVAANAQAENTPEKNDITVAVGLGYSQSISVSALDGAQTSYQMQALSNEWNQKALGLNVELGWFVTDTWKLNFRGGLSLVGNPGYGAKEGTFDAGASAVDDLGVNTGDIPSYRAVASQTTFNYNVAGGFAKYFKTKVPNLMPYVGARVGFAYALNAQHYDEYASMGKSLAESFNMGGAATMGIDYFVAKGMYVGVQIDPLSYVYNVTSYKPQEGLSALKGDSHNFSFLAAPTVKLGFKF